MNLAAIHRIAEQQYVKIWMLHILVHATLIQVVPGIGFNINTDRFHLSSNPKTGTGLCHRCPPSLLCRFFLFFTFPFFLLTPVMDLCPDPDHKRGNDCAHIYCGAGNNDLRIYHLVHIFSFPGGSSRHRPQTHLLPIVPLIMTGNRHHPRLQNHPLPWTCRQEAHRP